MASWFVRPEQTILKLSEGQTLTVKRRLNAGERRAQFARMYLAGVDGRLRVNPVQTGLAIILSYLVDWSLTDEAGHPVHIRGVPEEELVARLDDLEPEHFIEIRAAIEQHEEAMTAERETEKNGQDGAKGLPVISPSPSAAAGASSGSVN
jgi:hypothetical protein